MRRTFVILLLALAVRAAGARGGSDDSAADRKKAAGQPPKNERLIPIGAYGGQVLKVAEDGTSFTVRVHGSIPEVRFIPGNPCST
jgi:hypothetical protein